MKKLFLASLCLIILACANAQEPQKKWELKLGYEQPAFIKTAKIICDNFCPSPRGVMIRGLYEVWQDRLSLGVALGYNEKNYVCEDWLIARVDSLGFIYNIMDEFHDCHMYKRYYANAIVRFNAVNRGGFLFSLLASGGYDYSDYKQTTFVREGAASLGLYGREDHVVTGSDFNLMLGTEIGYEIVSNLLITAEYKFDFEHSMHLLGIGANIKL